MKILNLGLYTGNREGVSREAGHPDHPWKGFWPEWHLRRLNIRVFLSNNAIAVSFWNFGNEKNRINLRVFSILTPVLPLHGDQIAGL